MMKSYRCSEKSWASGNKRPRCRDQALTQHRGFFVYKEYMRVTTLAEALERFEPGSWASAAAGLWLGRGWCVLCQWRFGGADLQPAICLKRYLMVCNKMSAMLRDYYKVRFPLEKNFFSSVRWACKWRWAGYVPGSVTGTACHGKWIEKYLKHPSLQIQSACVGIWHPLQKCEEKPQNICHIRRFVFF